MSPINHLPEVVLQGIFAQYMADTTSTDGGTLMAVSKQWRIVATPLVHRNIILKHKRYRVGTDTHIDLSSSSAMSRAVSLGATGYTQTLAVYIHGLTSQEIQQKLSADGFCAAPWPRLTAVTLHGLPTQQAQLGSLRTFFSQYAPNIAAFEVAATIAQPPDVSALRSLDPTGASLSVDVQQLGADIPKDLAGHLTHLKLDAIDVRAAWSRIPAKFPNVTSLSLSFSNRASSMQPVASSNCDCMHATHALGVPRTRFCEHFAALSFPNLQSLAVERYPCPIANLLRSVPAAQITSLSVSGTSHSLESLDVQSFPNLVDCSITVCVDQARAAPVSIFEDPEQSEQVVNASRILSAALRGPSLLRTLHLAVSRATESVPLNVEHVGSKCLQTLTLAFAVTFASLAPIMQSSPRLRRLSVDSVTGSFAPAHCSASIEELEVCATGEMGVREFAALGSLTACLPSLVRLVVDDEPACRRLAHVSRSGIDVISGSSR